MGGIMEFLQGLGPDKLKEIFASANLPTPTPRPDQTIAGPSNPVATDGKVNGLPAAAPATNGLPNAEEGGILSKLFSGSMAEKFGIGNTDAAADARAGIISLGGNLAQASGPSDDPASGSFLTALSKGFSGYQGGKDSARDGRIKRDYIKSQTGRMNSETSKDQAAIARQDRAASIYGAAGAVDPNSPEFIKAQFDGAVASGNQSGINFWGAKMQGKEAVIGEKAAEAYGTASGTEAAQAPRRAEEADIARNKENVDNATQLEQNWRQSKTYTDFSNLSRARSQSEAIVKNPTAAGFASLVYDFAKIKDPGSVVQEGERMALNGTSSLPDQITSWVGRAANGEAPPREVVENLMGIIDTNYQAARKNYEYDKSGRMDSAAALKIDPSKIYSDPAPFYDPYVSQAQRDAQASRTGVPVAPGAPAAAPQAAPRPASTGRAGAGGVTRPQPQAAPAAPAENIPDVTGKSEGQLRQMGIKRGMKVRRDGVVVIVG